MTKFFAILIGLTFATSCLGLYAIIKLLAIVFPRVLDGQKLPACTIFCISQKNWLLAFAGLVLLHPVTLIFKQNVKMESVLVYSGIVFFVGAFLFFSIALAFTLPWIPLIN